MLGNAYLTLFVHSSGVMKQELIKKSYSSYERAEKLGQNFNPDLHYNRAQESFSIVLFLVNPLSVVNNRSLGYKIFKPHKVAFI